MVPAVKQSIVDQTPLAQADGMRQPKTKRSFLLVLLVGSGVLFCFYSCRTLFGGKASKAPFAFFVLGDWGRKGNGTQAAVARQMIAASRQQKPGLILTVGDNFYEEGVSSVTDPHWQAS